MASPVASTSRLDAPASPAPARAAPTDVATPADSHEPSATSTRKPAKEMTKAERRALQEKQREAKAAEKVSKDASVKAATLKPSAKPAQETPTSAKSAGKQRLAVNTAGPVIHDGPVTSNKAVMSLFLHLDPPKSAKSLAAKTHLDQVHPSIQRLALQYADFDIVGANARCLAMLAALKEVISTYTVPPGNTLSRHLSIHLTPQITHLIRARPLAVSMGNAIRYLKWEITQIPPDMPDDEAKALLIARIDHFIRDRIVLAGKVIEEQAIKKITDGDVIMTFARSSLVESVLLNAKREGKVFSVVVVDSCPMNEGRRLLQTLLDEGISCTYVLLGSIGSVLPTVSLTILGAHALLSNGAMFSRAGTAMVAMMSKGASIPVLCCCETYKFSDRVMLDSIVGNERGSTADLPLGNGLEENAQLGVLNFLYDVSRPEDVTAVVTEAAIIPASSVPFVLREHKPISLGA